MIRKDVNDALNNLKKTDSPKQTEEKRIKSKFDNMSPDELLNAINESRQSKPVVKKLKRIPQNVPKKVPQAENKPEKKKRIVIGELPDYDAIMKQENENKAVEVKEEKKEPVKVEKEKAEQAEVKKEKSEHKEKSQPTKNKKGFFARVKDLMYVTEEDDEEVPTEIEEESGNYTVEVLDEDKTDTSESISETVAEVNDEVSKNAEEVKAENSESEKVETPEPEEVPEPEKVETPEPEEVPELEKVETPEPEEVPEPEKAETPEPEKAPEKKPINNSNKSSGKKKKKKKKNNANKQAVRPQNNSEKPKENNKENNDEAKQEKNIEDSENKEENKPIEENIHKEKETTKEEDKKVTKSNEKQESNIEPVVSVKENKNKYNILRLAGIIIAVILVMAIINFCISNLGGGSSKEKFSKLVSSAIITDINSFESSSQLPDNQILNTAIWSIVMDDKKVSKYTNQAGIINIPAVDVEKYAFEIFGEDISQPTHATTGSAEYKFYYNSETESYSIQCKPDISDFSPEITSVSKEDGNYIVNVKYTEERPEWLGKSVSKALRFTLSKNNNGSYQINSMKILSESAVE